MSKAIIELPRLFNLSSLYEFVSSVTGPDNEPRHEIVSFDFSGLRFIEGDGLTVFCNTIEWLRKRGVRCLFRHYQVPSDAVRYLDDCGFFRTYLGAPLDPSASVRDTTLPFKKVRHADSHSWLEHEVSPWLAHKIGTVPEALYDVRTCIKEIFNNIVDHSTEEIGCIHIQWYPNRSQIHIAISDFGRGIPAAIAQGYSPADDGDAILLATQEGVTTKSIPTNRGAGLSILIDYVVARNQGAVDIYSGRGSLRCAYRSGGTTKRPRAGSAYYPGTLFNIWLRTDLIDRVELRREDLEW